MEYFDLVVPYLKNSFTVYALELPGFGDSPINQNTNYDQPFMIKAVADFIIKKKLSKVILAGESIGGVLCATVAMMLEEKIKKIYVFNPYDYDKNSGEGVRRASLLANFIIWSMGLPIIGNVFAALESRLIL